MEQVILVTGGSRGIGAATALLAAKMGYAVAVNYTANAGAAEEVVSEIVAAGGKAMAVHADVAHETQVLAMFAKVDAGLGRLTALVNNAGIVDVTARIEDMSVARWRRMFDINVIGSMICAREAVKRMSTRHGGAGGAIVNVSSAASRIGSPGQYVDYAASKGAVGQLTKALSNEWVSKGVNVNAIAPGYMRTDNTAALQADAVRSKEILSRIPAARWGEPSDMEGAIIFLSSAASDYLSGHVMTVDGGWCGR